MKSNIPFIEVLQWSVHIGLQLLLKLRTRRLALLLESPPWSDHPKLHNIDFQLDLLACYSAWSPWTMFTTSTKVHLLECDARVVYCFMRLVIHTGISIGSDRTMIVLEINPIVALNAVNIHSLILIVYLFNLMFSLNQKLIFTSSIHLYQSLLSPGFHTIFYFACACFYIFLYCQVVLAIDDYGFALWLCDRCHSGWSCLLAFIYKDYEVNVIRRSSESTVRSCAI